MSEIRPPIRQRTNRSRPDSSVPQKCEFFSVGGRLMASRSALSKACGSTQGPTMQARVMSVRMARLIRAARLRRNRARASAQGLRPVMEAAATRSMASCVGDRGTGFAGPLVAPP